MTTLPIHERFFSFQGEGVHMGRSAFFVRTFGCPLHCPWCDSASTWHPNYVPKNINRMDPIALRDEIVKANPAFVVITGGEPTIHDLTELTTLLRLENIPVHLETSGAFIPKGHFDWITLSPKRSRPALRQVVAAASEFKFIIEAPEDIDYWTREMLALGYTTAKPIWLHPEWSKRDSAEIKAAIVNAVKGTDFPYRAGWQLHKLYRADTLDSRSAPAAPLGGNTNLGF